METRMYYTCIVFLFTTLQGSTRIFRSRFHYKITCNLDMSLDKLKVCLVRQEQFMQQDVDF